MTATLDLPSVATNPWLTCSLLFTLRIFLPGLCWLWTTSKCPLPPPTYSFTRRAIIGGWACWISLLINLLVKFLLLETSLDLPPLEWTLILAISLTGLAIGARRRGLPAMMTTARYALPAILVVFLGCCLIMLLPNQGEWIAGGWDPGIYLNEGVWANRLDTFHPPSDPIYSLLTTNEIALFTKESFNYTAVYPAWPLDLQSREFVPFFFRLTPTAVAFVDQLGGLRAATRINMFMGLLSAICFISWVAQMNWKSPLAIFATIFLVVQPIWLYHLHVPISEMLQLTLLCGLLSWIPSRATNIFTRAFIPLGLFTLSINRFSFLPIGTLLLTIIAILDLQRADRKQVVTERLCQILAIGAAVAVNYITAGITIGRLSSDLTVVYSAACLWTVATLTIDVLGRQPTINKLLQYLLPRGIIPLLLLSIIVLAMLRPSVMCELAANTNALLSYIGVPLLLLAGGGFLIFFVDFSKSTRQPFHWIILFLIAISLLVLVKSLIMGIFPWATRRYLEFTVPAIAVLAGIFTSTLWQLRLKTAFAGPAIAIIFVTIVIGSEARLDRHALTRTEYNGLSEALATVAQHINKNDIVVADHFFYATPLSLIYGKSMINGEALWSRNNAQVMEEALKALRRLQQRGYRIRFLTSVPEGLSLYRAAITPVTLDWTSPEIHLDEIIHHVKARDFELRKKDRQFRLYTWGI